MIARTSVDRSNNESYSSWPSSQETYSISISNITVLLPGFSSGSQQLWTSEKDACCTCRLLTSVLEIARAHLHKPY